MQEILYSWGGLFSGIWWSFVFGVRCLWRHNLTSYSCLQTNVLAKFIDIICIFFYIHAPHFMCHLTEYKLSALEVRISEENKLNATTQQFITAKITDCALKQGRKTHSSMRQSHWCRRRRCRGCNRTPKTFDLVKIWAKSLEIREKSVEIWAKFVKRFPKSKCRRFFWRSYFLVLIGQGKGNVRKNVSWSVLWF